MFLQDIEKELKDIFNEFVTYYIPKEFQQPFMQDAYIAGGCIYSLANDEKPNDYDFFVTNKPFVEKLMNVFKNMQNICNISDNAVSFRDGKHQIITRYVGEPADVVGQFDFMHNMFYYYQGKLTGLVPDSYLKTNRLLFNYARARDVAGVLLRVPRFISRGMTISNAELASIITKLCENYNDNEKRILIEKSTYGHKYKYQDGQQHIQFPPKVQHAANCHIPSTSHSQRFNLPF